MITTGNFSGAEGREATAYTIANAASVSDVACLNGVAIIGIIMPAAWTAAALTVEVSADGTNFTGLAYNDAGGQCNSIATPAPGSAYAFSLAGLLPYRYVRLRSGTTAAPVNQAADRIITVITRPLA